MVKSDVATGLLMNGVEILTRSNVNIRREQARASMTLRMVVGCFTEWQIAYKHAPLRGFNNDRMLYTTAYAKTTFCLFGCLCHGARFLSCRLGPGPLFGASS